jgi:hypothetical protein
MRKALSGALVLAAAAVMLVLPASGVAGKKVAKQGAGLDVQHAGADVERGYLPIQSSTQANRMFGTRRSFAGDPIPGTQKTFLYLDDFQGRYRTSAFTLKVIGGHGEVWVQNNTAYPTGDCRNNTPGLTTVTNAQAQYLLDEFNNNIWPKEADAFATAPSLDGTNAILPGLLGLPQDTYVGDGNKTVILIANVRDDSYYDTNNAHGNSYIAGYFSGQLNDYFDRNVMTIDAYDWLHRTGATPPDDTAAATLCAPGRPRPFLYEGTFAHEYQHLLEHYSDPDEVNWINEGLSDWAMSLTGYAFPAIQFPTVGYDGHIQAFQGAFLPDPVTGRTGGPENSLTRWSDQTGQEILADYGAAYSFMTYLDDHYGLSFMSALHRAGGNGLVGLQDTLDALPKDGKKWAERDGKYRNDKKAGGLDPIKKATAMSLVNSWAVTMAVDGLLDKGAKLEGRFKENDYSSTNLSATINWANPDAYDTPGAPMNGSDYVRLRGASGNFLSGRDIDSLSFLGSKTLPPKPLLWSTVTDAPGHAGNSAYFGGLSANRDATMVRTVNVPTGADAKLTFDGYWNEEPGWDFGFVQVSTDGGVTYTSLACPGTTTDTDPEALPTAKANVPGFTGIVAGWQHVTCDLSAYAGKSVALQFRSYNDPLTFGADESLPAGFWVDNITVGTQVFDGSTIDGWKSMSGYHPSSVENFVVTILSVNGKKITLKTLPLNSDFATRGRSDGDRYIDRKADLVAAIVTYNDSTETSDEYAPYQLTVNGVVQPGGN